LSYTSRVNRPVARKIINTRNISGGIGVLTVGRMTDANEVLRMLC